MLVAQARQFTDELAELLVRLSHAVRPVKVWVIVHEWPAGKDEATVVSPEVQDPRPGGVIHVEARAGDRVAELLEIRRLLAPLGGHTFRFA